MTTSQTDPRETLSALLDNEADDLELRRLLNSWDSLPENEQRQLSETWSRYHLQQSVLHEQGVPVSPGLAAAVSVALEDEAEHRGGRGLPVWQQTLAKFAVAASVAAVAFVVLQGDFQPAETSQVAESATPESATAPEQAGGSALLAGSEPVEIDPESQQLLYDYIRGINIDPAESAGFEHFEDSSLYRLVNQLPEQD